MTGSQKGHGLVKNEQVKKKWPQLDTGTTAKAATRLATPLSLPMENLYRKEASPPERAEIVTRGTQSAPPPAEAPARATRAPRVNRMLSEQQGRCTGGWLGLLAAGLAIAGGAVLIWYADRVPDPLASALTLPAAPATVYTTWFMAGAVACCGAALLCLAGLSLSRSGSAMVLHSLGGYRATLRRTGLVWHNPFRRRRRVDVRLRHWHSEIGDVSDSDGIPLRSVVMVVWQVRDTARALYAVDDFEKYLKEQIEGATTAALAARPCDAFNSPEPSLRDNESLSAQLTRTLTENLRPVGLDVYSVQILRLGYAPEVADTMRQRQLAALETRHRDHILEEVAEAVEATTRKITEGNGAEWDDYERKAFVRELTVAFYAARTSAIVPPVGVSTSPSP